jgi:hypothetical protein
MSLKHPLTDVLFVSAPQFVSDPLTSYTRGAYSVRQSWVNPVQWSCVGVTSGELDMCLVGLRIQRFGVMNLGMLRCM